MNHYLNNNSDIAKAKVHAILSTEKLPALNETIKFIFDICHGRRARINTKTINDAFECIDNRDKTIIYSSDLHPEEKEQRIHQTELDLETRKQMLSSFLSFMEAKYKYQQYNNFQGNNNFKKKNKI
ncbi:MAG: hypothetical protein E7081_07750 [Bacteroidales bacterium]|nr:hypothetical protein [Bacteroidales bacterium]